MDGLAQVSQGRDRRLKNNFRQLIFKKNGLSELKIHIFSWNKNKLLMAFYVLKYSYKRSPKFGSVSGSLYLKRSC